MIKIFLKFNRIEESMARYRLFIGNPGVGKSTLANCMAKTVLFKSGVSFGEGMTYQLDEKIYDGVTYLDTPGLADIKIRKKAAEAITDGLKRNGQYQIFFVVTSEAGRLRPADLATIKLVLGNAEKITSYSLIINKLTKHVYDNLLKDDGKEVKKLAAELDFQARKNTNPPKLLPLLSNMKLYDAENEIVAMNDLDEFVKHVPYENLDRNNIKDIPGDDKSFEETITLVTEEINKLRSDKEQMRKQLKKTEERYKNSAEKKVKFLLLTYSLTY